MLEAHYLLNPPHTVQRIDQDGVTVLPVPLVVSDFAGPGQAWGYEGSGTLATAGTLLLDALGNRVPGDLRGAAGALVRELLAGLSFDAEHTIGVRELREWANDDLPRAIATEARRPLRLSMEERQANLTRFLNDGGYGRPSWFDRYRAEHGPVGLVEY